MHIPSASAAPVTALLTLATAASALLLSATPAQAQLRPLSSTPHTTNPLEGPHLSDPLRRDGPLGVTRLQAAIGPGGDSDYQPQTGQPGKDVVWVPTPQPLIEAMLRVADVKPGDFVVDLGAGDGRIAIAAARDFGAQALGIEYDPNLVALARRNAARAGVAGLASFRRADIFATDFSNATVVTLYLLPSLNLRLRDRLLAMKPGTRIVSHAFTMGEWEPERTISTDDAYGYFWIVPANIAGRWAFEANGRRFAAEIGQQFQHLTMAPGGALRHGRVKGTAVTLTRSDGSRLTGEISENREQMAGPGWLAIRIHDRR